MRMLMLILTLCQLLYGGPSRAAERHQEVVVADPFLELHTGPGRGYPVFQVIERGEQVALLKRRTSWFLVRTPGGREGWVPRDQLERTLTPSGGKKRFRDPTLNDYADSRWEVGALYGDFGGANVIATYGAYSVTPNISFELWMSQALGRFSNSYMGNVNIVHTMFPEWRATPYFTLGTGVIRTEPKATLVRAPDRTDNMAHVGVGARAYLTRRFLVRAEYKSYVVFTSRDDNEEIREWKAGVSFFF